MAQRKSYNLEALVEALKRDNAVLLKDYDKITRRTLIYFRCHCGKEGNKKCLEIVSRAGAYCKDCTTKHFTEKFQQTIHNKKK